MAATSTVTKAYLASAIGASILLAIVVTQNVYRKRQKETGASPSSKDDEPSDSQRDEIDISHLPAHLERNLLKERRWRRMIPKLAMKKPLYDNILMKDPDGIIVCSVSLKKANWYIGKELAKWETDDHVSMRLFFTPRGNSSASTSIAAPISANRTRHESNESRHKKENRCVVCGRNDPAAFYMRHSIVPYSFRSLFPARYKTHLPHDIVILCARTCHVPAGKYANDRIHELEEQLLQEAPPQKYIVDSGLRSVKNAAMTLLRRRKELPAARVQELEGIVLDHFQTIENSSIAAVPESLLIKSSQLNDRTLNPDYKTASELILESLQQQQEPYLDQALTAFIKDWRKHFVETMQPEYLPFGWSIDSPVKCDDRVQQ